MNAATQQSVVYRLGQDDLLIDRSLLATFLAHPMRHRENRNVSVPIRGHAVWGETDAPASMLPVLLRTFPQRLC